MVEKKLRQILKNQRRNDKKNIKKPEKEEIIEMLRSIVAKDNKKMRKNVTFVMEIICIPNVTLN